MSSRRHRKRTLSSHRGVGVDRVFQRSSFTEREGWQYRTRCVFGKDVVSREPTENIDKKSALASLNTVPCCRRKNER